MKKNKSKKFDTSRLGQAIISVNKKWHKSSGVKIAVVTLGTMGIISIPVGIYSAKWMNRDKNKRIDFSQFVPLSKTWYSGPVSKFEGMFFATIMNDPEVAKWRLGAHSLYLNGAKTPTPVMGEKGTSFSRLTPETKPHIKDYYENPVVELKFTVDEADHNDIYQLPADFDTKYKGWRSYGEDRALRLKKTVDEWILEQVAGAGATSTTVLTDDQKSSINLYKMWFMVMKKVQDFNLNNNTKYTHFEYMLDKEITQINAGDGANLHEYTLTIWASSITDIIHSNGYTTAKIARDWTQHIRIANTYQLMMTPSWDLQLDQVMSAKDDFTKLYYCKDPAVANDPVKPEDCTKLDLSNPKINEWKVDDEGKFHDPATSSTAGLTSLKDHYKGMFINPRSMEPEWKLEIMTGVDRSGNVIPEMAFFDKLDEVGKDNNQSVRLGFVPGNPEKDALWQKRDYSTLHDFGTARRDSDWNDMYSMNNKGYGIITAKPGSTYTDDPQTFAPTGWHDWSPAQKDDIYKFISNSFNDLKRVSHAFMASKDFSSISSLAEDKIGQGMLNLLIDVDKYFTPNSWATFINERVLPHVLGYKPPAGTTTTPTIDNTINWAAMAGVNIWHATSPSVPNKDETGQLGLNNKPVDNQSFLSLLRAMKAEEGGGLASAFLGYEGMHAHNFFNTAKTESDSNCVSREGPTYCVQTSFKGLGSTDDVELNDHAKMYQDGGFEFSSVHQFLTILIKYILPEIYNIKTKSNIPHSTTGYTKENVTKMIDYYNLWYMKDIVRGMLETPPTTTTN